MPKDQNLKSYQRLSSLNFIRGLSDPVDLRDVSPEEERSKSQFRTAKVNLPPPWTFPHLKLSKDQNLQSYQRISSIYFLRRRVLSLTFEIYLSVDVTRRRKYLALNGYFLKKVANFGQSPHSPLPSGHFRRLKFPKD